MRNDDICSTNSKLLSPSPPHLLLEILMMSFSVMLQDIWVEESLAAEWAHQPHPQVYFPYMGTNSSPQG